jgi:hypothetical protein
MIAIKMVTRRFAGLVEPVTDVIPHAELQTPESAAGAARLQHILDHEMSDAPSARRNKFTVDIRVEHARHALEVTVRGTDGEEHRHDVLEYVPGLRNVMKQTGWKVEELFHGSAHVQNGGNTLNFLEAGAMTGRGVRSLTGAHTEPVRFIGPDDAALREQILDTHGGGAEYFGSRHLARRVSLHLKYEIAEANRQKLLKEMMLSTPGSPIERQREALREGIADLPLGSSVVTPADLSDDRDTHVDLAVIPSSWAPLRTSMLGRQQLFINADELKKIAPDLDLPRFEDAFDRLLQGDPDAAREIDPVLWAYWAPHAQRDSGHDRRVTSIGMNKGSLTVFRLAHEPAFHVVATGFMTRERDVVELLDAPHEVSWDVTSQNGRGDAMAAGSVLDAYAAEIIRYGGRMSEETDLDRQRLRLACRILPSLGGLTLGLFAGHSDSPNLGDVPPDAMAKVLHEIGRQASDAAKTMDPHDSALQQATTDWGVPVSAWTSKA